MIRVTGVLGDKNSISLAFVSNYHLNDSQGVKDRDLVKYHICAP